MGTSRASARLQRVIRRVLQEVAQAKSRFGLPETAPMVRCYEAGREGFWLHRFVQARGITNHMGDSSAIAVSRRKRRAKSDALDVRKLLRLLRRYQSGERQGWRVVPVPAVEAEEQRQLHWALETLKQERASTTARRNCPARSDKKTISKIYVRLWALMMLCNIRRSPWLNWEKPSG